ncbi:hypothetical protein K1T71_008125, partial [Dendrolimus kikuchii]
AGKPACGLLARFKFTRVYCPPATGGVMCECGSPSSALAQGRSNIDDDVARIPV